MQSECRKLEVGRKAGKVGKEGKEGKEGVWK
jgi:hypothetical protein